MSATSSTPAFSTISSPVTQTRVVEVTSQSSLTQPTSSSSVGPSNPFPSPDPNQNPNPDPFNTGPSVYLYGFLATLGLIFLVSFAIAWRGYYARRALRARIEEALARGVVLPGYTGDYRWAGPVVSLGPRPVIYDAWMDIKQEKEKPLLIPNAWDIKPASLDLLRPVTPAQDRNASISPLANASSLLHQLMSPIRDFRLASSPEGTHSGRLQGRSAQSINTRTSNARDSSRQNNGEDGIKWDGAEGVALSILIAMPNRDRPTRPMWSGRGNEASYVESIPMGYSAPGGSSNAETREHTEEEKDLPEVMFGYSEVPLPAVKGTMVDSMSGSGMGARTMSEGGRVWTISTQ